MLQDYGERVQKSTFEAEVLPRDVRTVIQKAARYAGANDSLRVYSLCANCKKGLQTLRIPNPRHDATLYIV